MILNVQLLGEIRNGFTSTSLEVAETIRYLENLLHEDKSKESKHKYSLIQRSRLKNELRRIEKLSKWKEITINLLLEFQTVAPDLFNELNDLKDSNDRSIDVYVKFLPHGKMIDSPSGFTRLSYRKEDNTVYTNEYGDNSISIHISYSEMTALTLLAHELGHAKYIVPNIGRYHHFYKKRFENNEIGLKGHTNDDQSSRYAKEFERKFRSCLAIYKRKIRRAQYYLEPSVNRLNYAL